MEEKKLGDGEGVKAPPPPPPPLNIPLSYGKKTPPVSMAAKENHRERKTRPLPPIPPEDSSHTLFTTPPLPPPLSRKNVYTHPGGEVEWG